MLLADLAAFPFVESLRNELNFVSSSQTNQSCRQSLKSAIFARADAETPRQTVVGVEAENTETPYNPAEGLKQVAQEITPKSGKTENGVDSKSKDFYGILSFAAAAVGQSHLSLLFTGIGAAEDAITKLDKAYHVLPQEVERFAATLESVRETLECTLEECKIDGVFNDDERDVPPQVFEITQLIAEGEDFIRGLKEADQGFVSVIANQLLAGNDCPCSKLSQLSAQIKEAESKLQLYKAVQLVRKQNEEQVFEVRLQMEELQSSIKELVTAKQIYSQQETDQARKTHQLLREESTVRLRPLKKLFSACIRPVKFTRQLFSGRLQQTTKQFDQLKDEAVLNELFGAIDADDDMPLFVTPKYLQQIEDSRYPLRIETPIPANEAKRLRVLRDLRLVQLEMEGNSVGKGFEYHRNELVRTVVKLLRDTLPECEAFALQVVGDQDSYTLTGEHRKAPVTPRSQVPCQHVMCLSTSDQAKMHGSIDGYTCDNVLAINLRGKHSELTKNFCYTTDTLSYVGAAIRISDVTIGSLCMASNKSLQELQWNKRKSAFVRKVATVLEEQLTRLCVDWTLYDGELPSDWDLFDIDISTISSNV